MNDIRDNIKEICKEKGLKQEVIAEKFGITQSSLSQKLTRNEDIKYGFLLKIANILKVDVIDVIKYPVKYVPETVSCEECKQLRLEIKHQSEYIEILKSKKK
jgi:transcriptional regulator with XRE-family HTH domain